MIDKTALTELSSLFPVHFPCPNQFRAAAESLSIAYASGSFTKEVQSGVSPRGGAN
jgi:hypothetical protein